jgi:hypothetical protein
MINHSLSLLSHALHYVAFTCRKPVSIFDKGILVISIDVDVGCKEIGVKNRGKNDLNVHKYLTEEKVGEIEESVMPSIIKFFNEMEIPVTFALRGQLTETEGEIIKLLLKSPLKHDIGAHGYYHKAFTTLSWAEANKELEMTSNGMKKFGIKPKSFVFPKNKVAHLPLLEKWGYLCFRKNGSLLEDGMYVKKYGNLYDVHPGLYLGKCNNPTFMKKIVNISVRHKALFHLWFHLWNLGNSLEAINKRITKVLLPFLKYAKEKQKYERLCFETMCSLSEKSSLCK